MCRRTSAEGVGSSAGRQQGPVGRANLLPARDCLVGRPAECWLARRSVTTAFPVLSGRERSRRHTDRVDRRDGWQQWAMGRGRDEKKRGALALIDPTSKVGCFFVQPGWEARGGRAGGGTTVWGAGGGGRGANGAGFHPVLCFPIPAPAHVCGPRLGGSPQSHGMTTSCDGVGVEGGGGVCVGARALGGAGGGGGENQARPQLCHCIVCRCLRRDAPARGSKEQAGAARRIGGGVARGGGNRGRVESAGCCRATCPPLDRNRPHLREAFTRTQGGHGEPQREGGKRQPLPRRERVAHSLPPRSPRTPTATAL